MITIQFVTLPWFLNVIKWLVIHTVQRIVFMRQKKYSTTYTCWCQCCKVTQWFWVVKHNQTINITIITLTYSILCLRKRFIRCIDRKVAVGIRNGKHIALIRLYYHSLHYEGRPMMGFLGNKRDANHWLDCSGYSYCPVVLFPSNHDLRLELPQERT